MIVFIQQINRTAVDAVKSQPGGQGLQQAIMNALSCSGLSTSNLCNGLSDNGSVISMRRILCNMLYV